MLMIRVFIILLICSFSFGLGKYRFTIKNYNNNNILFTAKSCSEFLAQATGISYTCVQLKNDEKIFNILFPKDSVIVKGIELNKNHIRFILPSKDIVINNVKLKANTILRFYNNGSFQSGVLLENTKIEGYLFKKETPIVFYENQYIEYGYSAKEFQIQIQNTKIIIKEGDFLPFLPNGTIDVSETTDFQRKFGDALDKRT